MRIASSNGGIALTGAGHKVRQLGSYTGQTRLSSRVRFGVSSEGRLKATAG